MAVQRHETVTVVYTPIAHLLQNCLIFFNIASKDYKEYFRINQNLQYKQLFFNRIF